MKAIFKTIPLLIFATLFSFINLKAQTKVDDKDTTYSNKDRACSKVEIEASFPGGAAAWTKYITKQIIQNVDEFRKKDYGTCIVKFIVNKEGYISEVEATTMKNSRLAKVAVNAIENGPRWIPAQQNGRYVNAYRLQPVTLSDPSK
jgi:protein TonB